MPHQTPQADAGEPRSGVALFEHVVQTVLREEDGKPLVEEAELSRRYPELMPQLAEVLRTERSIRAAARQAAESRRSDARGDGVFSDDIALLTKALDGYEVLQRLDQGGQGVVYKAIQTASDRTVAIKVLVDGPLASDRQRHRFEREVKLVSRMRHPNIVALFDSGVVRGRQYFVMEYVDGLPIDDFVLFHRLLVDDAVSLFCKVCRAISSAHQRGIIHRDLKPGNILVDAEGEPHVLDFGLAKSIEDIESGGEAALISVTGIVPGTLPYLSPEQARSDSGSVDVRSDVYALGVVLHRILTGDYPYDVSADAESVRSAIISQTPRTLSKSAQDPGIGIRPTTGQITDDLDRIVGKTLAKEQARRYQSAGEFADDLDRYLRNEAVVAKADSSFYVLRKMLRKYRLQAVFAGVLLVILAASSVLVTSLWWQARAQRNIAWQVATLAHETLDEVVNEFERSIRTLAGGTAVRDRLMSKMALRLEALRPLVESDVELSGVAAAIREKQGDVAEAMGRREEAADHYRASIKITLESTNATHAAESGRGGDGERAPEQAMTIDGTGAPVETWLAIARANRKLARVVDNPDDHYSRAAELQNTVRDRFPELHSAAVELCTTHLAMAHHNFNTGRYQEAARHAAIAEDLIVALGEGDPVFPTPEGARRGDLLASARGLHGRSLLVTGEGDKGMRLLETSVDARRQAVQKRPTDVQQRHGLLIDCAVLAAAYRDVGRSGEAVALLNQALENGQYLVSVDPTVMAWRQSLYATHDLLARYLRESGSLEQAEDHCTAAVTLAEGFVSIEPDNATWRQILAFSLVGQGRLLLDQDQAADAHDSLARALEIRTALANQEPENHTAQVELATAHDYLGQCLARLKRMPESHRHYEAAHEIRLKLLAAQPKVVKRRADVIFSQSKLATSYLRRKTVEADQAALELLKSAAAALRELHAAGRLDRLRGKYKRWMDNINKNLDLINRRALRRQMQTDGGTPSNPPASRPG